jgi:hypothetical protein
MSLYTAQDNGHLLDAYETQLRQAAQSIEDDVYRNIALNALARLEYLSLLRASPYGMEGPLAHVGGLLTHTAHLVNTVQAISAECRDIDDHIDQSFAVIGSLFYNVGWHTTTIIIDGEVKRRDAFLTTGIRESGFRFMHDLLLHVESDLDLAIPEERKQALGNIYLNPLTLEGKLISQANDIIDTILFAGHSI